MAFLEQGSGPGRKGGVRRGQGAVMASRPEDDGGEGSSGSDDSDGTKG